jgi:sterol desaturase/sphingolipid hydroxylase (fatty acid hydroxylase superfamily)
MRKQKVMFDNRVIELLSRSNPFIIAILHSLLISSVLTYGLLNFELSASVGILLFITGILSWTLAEYVIHRFVFHWRSRNRILKVIHYALHGHHHENPTDSNHLFMPPIPVLMISFFLFTIFFLFMNKFTFYFFPGFELGYLVYSMIHYSVHLKPYSNGIMRKLWIHHGKHHYENSNMRYGVSNTFWDHVFRTMPKNNG